MKVLTIVGPTGVGKTEVSFRLAKRNKLEIISADARSIYQGMDIGTAKPTSKMREEVNFHLLDLITPDQVFNAQDFGKLARAVMDKLRREGKKFFVSGGSGLYLKALFKPLAELPKIDPDIREGLKGRELGSLYHELKAIDPISASKIHPRDRQRVIRALEVFYQTKRPLSSFFGREEVSEYEPVYVGLILPRKSLHQRIEERLERMVEGGFLKEVKRLLSLGYAEDLYAFNAFGYREMMLYLKGRLAFEEAIRQAKKKIKDYAKRQITWFKREDVYWIENYDFNETVLEIERIFPEIKR